MDGPPCPRKAKKYNPAQSHSRPPSSGTEGNSFDHEVLRSDAPMLRYERRTRATAIYAAREPKAALARDPSRKVAESSPCTAAAKTTLDHARPCALLSTSSRHFCTNAVWMRSG